MLLNKKKTPEEWHEQELKIIEDYRPIDDEFMRELFRNDIPLTQYVLRVITGIEDLEIISQETQYDLNHLVGLRSVRLDVVATGNEGEKMNLEVQRSDSGAAPQRARYHSSAIDVEFLKQKAEFTELPISYVIFITENDVIGDNKLIYKFDRLDTETGKPLKDGTHIIFVNSAYDNPRDTSELAKLAHDFCCKNADDMLTKPLADKTRYLKNSPEGVTSMSKAMEDFKNEVAREAAREAAIETARNEKIQFAINLLKDGSMSNEKISQLTGLSIEDVQAIENLYHLKTA